MKTCTKCLLFKPLNSFSLNKRGLYGKRAECKLCQKEYRSINKDKIKILNKAWKENNPLYSRSLEQQEKVKEYKRKYHQQAYANLSESAKIKLRERKNNFEYKKRKLSIPYRIKALLRSRLNQAIKNIQKTGSAVANLGCSIEEFKIYLESKFQPGMSWDNWGRFGWHIDHKVPLSKFNLADPHELKKACHYTNLQPLWANENLRKSNK